MKCLRHTCEKEVLKRKDGYCTAKCQRADRWMAIKAKHRATERYFQHKFYCLDN